MKSKKKIAIIIVVLTVLFFLYALRAIYIGKRCKEEIAQLPTEQSEYGEFIIGADFMFTTCLKEHYVVPLEILK